MARLLLDANVPGLLKTWLGFGLALSYSMQPHPTPPSNCRPTKNKTCLVGAAVAGLMFDASVPNVA